MIKEIKLDNHVLRYQITFKNNKNTYFHFRRIGYIQINASRYQTHKGILDYIKSNKVSFIKKYEKTKSINRDNDDYYLLGERYKRESNLLSNNLKLDNVNRVIKEPSISIDQLKLLYKYFEKDIILKKLQNLKEKYFANGYVDISDITFKTRYMQTRFGSCNPIKKTININLYLVNYDEKYIEYVFLHEITHLVHHNHSAEYYFLLKKLLKDHKQLKKELNQIFNYR